MLIDILTIFPEMFAGYLGESILKRAQEKGLVELRVHNLRDWATDKHRMTDDRPFGGGPGMVMKAEPIFLAVEQLKKTWNLKHGIKNNKGKVILLSPQGRMFKQEGAKELSEIDYLILICGRYEGVDQRVIDSLIDEELSIGEYVLTGGELPAMVVLDAVTRLLPGVLGNPESLVSETFNKQLTTDNLPLTVDNPSISSRQALQHKAVYDYPVYTQPSEFRGMKVPEVLMSGNHQKIAKWREGTRKLKLNS